MDEERRRLLVARRDAVRAATRAREGHETLAPALDEIRSAGTPHRILALDDDPHWLAGWFPPDWGRIPWERMRPAIDRSFDGEPDSEEAKYALVRDALRARAGPAEPLRVMTGRLGLSLAMAGADVVRHLRAILATYGFETWIAPEHDPQWLIDVRGTQVYAADFPPVSQWPAAPQAPGA